MEQWNNGTMVACLVQQPFRQKIGIEFFLCDINPSLLHETVWPAPNCPHQTPIQP
jgi:hypothetical protein